MSHITLPCSFSHQKWCEITGYIKNNTNDKTLERKYEHVEPIAGRRPFYCLSNANSREEMRFTHRCCFSLENG